MNIRRFDLDARGLARVVGELEAQVLESIWELGRPTVKEVVEALGPDAHVKTIMTVMNRLVDKRLLRRERHGRAFYYEVSVDRDAFAAQIAKQVMNGLLADFPRPTLAHLIDEANAEQLAELETLIRSRRHGA